MATMYDFPETPLNATTMVSDEDEDKALVHIVNIGARNNATAEELAAIIEVLGLSAALDRLRKDVEMR